MRDLTFDLAMAIHLEHKARTVHNSTDIFRLTTCETCQYLKGIWRELEKAQNEAFKEERPE